MLEKIANILNFGLIEHIVTYLYIEERKKNNINACSFRYFYKYLSRKKRVILFTQSKCANIYVASEYLKWLCLIIQFHWMHTDLFLSLLRGSSRLTSLNVIKQRCKFFNYKFLFDHPKINWLTVKENYLKNINASVAWHPFNRVLQAAQRIYKLLFAYTLWSLLKKKNSTKWQSTISYLHTVCKQKQQ